MKSFADRRAAAIAEVQASTAYRQNDPARGVNRPVSRLPTKAPKPFPGPSKPVELLTVSRLVLMLVLDALQSGDPLKQKVAAEMIRLELGAPS